MRLKKYKQNLLKLDINKILVCDLATHLSELPSVRQTMYFNKQN